MGVRIKVRIRGRGGSLVEANALLNTSFESEEPEAIVPVRVAEILGFWPMLPQGTVIRAFETTGGTVRMAVIGERAEVQVITEDRVTQPLKCSLVISELESEVLLSDKAIEALEIVIEAPAGGIWRFKGEEKPRHSEEPQYW